MARVILYIATSQDGFIADKDGVVDWLPQPDDYPDPNDELGYQALMSRISTIVMGRRSFTQIIGFGDWAWKGQETYVFTSQDLLCTREDIHCVHEGVKSFMDNLNHEGTAGDIWLLGGAELAKSFARERLIDECIITIVPTILNEGIKLELPFKDFTLSQEKSCVNQIVQQRYILK